MWVPMLSSRVYYTFPMVFPVVTVFVPFHDNPAFSGSGIVPVVLVRVAWMAHLIFPFLSAAHQIIFVLCNDYTTPHLQLSPTEFGHLVGDCT